MANTPWKTGTVKPLQRQVTWPSPSQVIMQISTAIIISVLWLGLLAGFLVVTGQRAALLAAIGPEPTATATPTHTATPLPTATAQPTFTPASSETEAGTSNSPLPLPTDTPLPPTETPAPTQAPEAEGAGGVSFSADVVPILERRCLQCHGGEKPEGGLRIEEGFDVSTYDDILFGSWNGPVIEPGNADDSLFVEQVITGEMPKKGPRLLPAEVRTLTEWVNAGAPNN